MIARCIGNRADGIPQYLGVLFFELSVQFALTVGASYPVLGMELYRESLQLLVPDNSDHRRPQWMPSELFEIDISELPTGWFFRAYPEGSSGHRGGFRARWGYRLLVESDDHRDGLEEYDPAALAVFSAELRRVTG
jgi:hypothetical protein